MPAAIPPTVDMMPEINSQVTLFGPPVVGRGVLPLMVSPKPSDPIVARAHIKSTTKKTRVIELAKLKNFCILCGRIHRRGSVATQKIKYDRNWADVIPVEAGIVLGMCFSRDGSHDRSMR